MLMNYSELIYVEDSTDYICGFRGIEKGENYLETKGLYKIMRNEAKNNVDEKELL